jgi:hypothetical protein
VVCALWILSSEVLDGAVILDTSGVLVAFVWCWKKLLRGASVLAS